MNLHGRGIAIKSQVYNGVPHTFLNYTDLTSTKKEEMDLHADLKHYLGSARRHRSNSTFSRTIRKGCGNNQYQSPGAASVYTISS